MDISPEMCAGVKRLSELCNINLDDYIVGSYENIKEVCPCRFDAIANYDVLEHLYDPIVAFKKLGELLNKDGIILMASSANKYNPLINSIYKKYHHMCEYKGGNTSSFFNIRIKLIKESFADIKENEIKLLALRTRGKRREDILKAVRLYKNTGELPALPNNTNTCDPITGNGSENLLNAFWIVQALRRRFRSSEVGTGYFPITRLMLNRAGMIRNNNIINNTYPYLLLLAKFFAPLLNLLIYILPLRIRIVFSPYYFIKVSK